MSKSSLYKQNINQISFLQFESQMFKNNQVVDETANQIHVISLNEKEKPNLNNNQQINPEINYDQNDEDERRLNCFGPFCSESKELGIFTFFFMIFSCIANASDPIYILDPNADALAMNLIYICTVIPRIAFYMTVGIKLVGFKMFLKYCVLLDPIAFPLGLAVYSYIVFLVSIFVLDASDYVAIVLVCLQFIGYAGFHRIVMVQIKWRKWQVIIYKIALAGAATAYVVVGIRYIFPGINWTDGEQPEVDSTIKQFMILFIIGSADFVVKLFEKVCDLDKTAAVKIDEEGWNSYIVME